MIKGKRVLAIIPARGGSKGIPRKNIKSFAGKPLIAWSIEEAKKSKYIDRVILTSEDDEIITSARKYGCEVPFIRPDKWAKDDTPGIMPVLHAIGMIPGFDYSVLLQPTSPLRTVNDIDGTLEMCIEANADSCVTVTEVTKSPLWMYYLSNRLTLRPVIKTNEKFLCRQKLPKAYALNGAVYVAKTEWLFQNKAFIGKDTIAYIMPKERSIDIDDEIDFFIAELMVLRKSNL